MYFVAYCSELQLRYQTIKIYLAGIRYHYIRQNIPCPLSNISVLHQLQYSLTGIKKSQDNSTTKRLPITIDILNSLLTFLETKRGIYESRMFMAACTLAFFGFLRCGEFTTKNSHTFDPQTDLCLGDISMSKSSFNLQLKDSKTDIFRKGITIPYYATGKLACPVRLMKNHIDSRLKSGAKAEAPLFITAKGTVLDRQTFITTIKSTISELGLDPSTYNGHSFRIGAATTAAKVHIPDHLIKTLGRWSSDCYNRYIHIDRDHICQAQKQMAN